MNDTFRCDTGALMAYLYDDGDPVERRTVEAHLERCDACAQEIAALGHTRSQLAAWTPPSLQTSFQIDPAVMGTGPATYVATSAMMSPGPRLVASSVPSTLPPAATVSPWWQRPLPAWAQAAAAVVIFASGLALGAVRGTVPNNAVPNNAVPNDAVPNDAVPNEAVSNEATRAAAAPRAPQAASVSTEELARVEQMLRNEIAGLREAAMQKTAGPAPVVDVNRVEALIAASEERQRRELATRTVQLVRDFDLQRQADLLRVQQALGQFQGTTTAEVRQHRDAIEELVRRVSQTGR